MGISFKKNCSDIRNSKIIEVINFLKLKKSKIQIHDPLVDSKILKKNNLLTLSWDKLDNNSDVIIIFSYHDQFKKISNKEIKKKIHKNGVIIDIMSELSDDKIKKIDREIWAF